MEKREPLYTVGGNVKLVQPLWKTVWKFLERLKTELPYNPSILLLGYIPRETIIQKGTCTPVFIAALFTIARTWKQLKCPSIKEWIKKMWYIYTKEYYSAIKKNKIMPFVATWMDLEIVILSEGSQTDKYMICEIFKNLIFFFCGIRKKVRMNLSTKEK